MRKIIIITLCLIQLTVSAYANEHLKLWYSKPASLWNEALPIGNGRLGAMVYGNPSIENIQLNEGTFWSGGPCTNNNPNALASLSSIRELIFAGSWDAAQTLADNSIKSTTNQGQKYQSIGNLQLTFPGHSTYTNYYRELDLERAVITTTHALNGVTYTEEVFASKPQQVIIIRLSASQAGKISFTSTLNGSLKTSLTVLNVNTLEMKGLSGSHEGVTGMVKSSTRVKIINTGGTITSTSTNITVAGANQVLLIVSIATNFVDYKTLTADESGKSQEYLNSASAKTYTELLSNHITSYQSYFNRVNLNLGTSAYANYPTDVRLKYFAKTKDPDFVSLYYQLGRYLLISSSQPGGQPATLQGLWNDQTDPVWDSKYTTNINLQMNYWPAEKTNLTEMHEPLIQMTKELAVTGAVTAKTMYGAEGWVLHHNTDLWRTTGMVDGAYYGMWPTGSAWLSQHVWEKFLYSGDTAYLRSVYPVLRDACKFYQSFLVKEPKNNWMVVCPSMSPENNPSVHGASIAAGVTMDNQLLFDLFNKTMRATNILKTDSTFALQLKVLRNQLPPMQVGQYGQLQEWMDDWDNPADKNRHVSHLYGLFPSNQITASITPELFDAARTSLTFRGDISTGWSMGWKINLWARLFEGEHAYKLITNQLTYVDPSVTSTSFSGGTYPNLFDAHPPFQIDGNFGCTSGVTEMLMQSHDGAVQLLPAMPADWKDGSVSGLRAYGGFDLDFSWENAEVQKITIKSNLGGNFRIRMPNKVAMENGTQLTVASGINPNPFFTTDSVTTPRISPAARLNKPALSRVYEYDFQTEAGKTYTLVPFRPAAFDSAYVFSQQPDRISLKLDIPVAQQQQYTGFTVKVNSQSVCIDTIEYVADNQSLMLKLSSPVQKDDVITIAYVNGNVKSTIQSDLLNFTDTLVENGLIGAAPLLRSVSCNREGSILIVEFSKKMMLPSDASELQLIINDNSSRRVLLTNPVYDRGDSSIVSFSVSEKLYADYQVLLSYTGTTWKASDQGFLKLFSNRLVTNASLGLPLEIVNAESDSTGSSVILTFNKEVYPVLNQTGSFSLKVSGSNSSILDMVVIGKSISLQLGTKLKWGENVSVSYSPGVIKATDSGTLAAFSDFLVQNDVLEPTWFVMPGKMEAEGYYAQYGTQTETCGDTDGGSDVGYIDTNDWMEYAVNVPTTGQYKLTFRTGSIYSTGVIHIYVDNLKAGQISIPKTAGWQTYVSSDVNLNFGEGKHFVKLLAATGGFNINWVLFEKVLTNILESPKEAENVQIYSDPSRNRVIVNSPLFPYEKVEVFNMEGKLVFEKAGYQPIQNLNRRFPVGNYLLILIGTSGSVQKLFIVK